MSTSAISTSPDPPSRLPRYLLGVDVGGTFTDVSLLNADDGSIIAFKSPTISSAPAAGVAEAISRLPAVGIDPSRIEYFVHGTTIALNSLLERSGPNVALLVTEGFRDILELGRLRLPNPFDFHSGRQRPLVPRWRVVTVRERILADGQAILPLTDEEAERVAGEVERLGVASVAVCLLHSYRDGSHERLLRDVLLTRLPGLFVSCSCELWPEIREYERALVAVMNAYSGPSMARYAADLMTEIGAVQMRVRPYLTRSNGGIMTIESARDQPVHTLLSGPAAGVIGALDVAGKAGIKDFVTLDIGGTSADISIVEHSRVSYSRAATVGGFPLALPAVAVSSIGAGGGSICWLDSAGIPKVGPMSAGAIPGPACYGLGGQRPTLTDAFLTCGYISEESFAGDIRLDPRLAQAALADLGTQLGWSLDDVAAGLIAVALANMYTEFSGVVERRGIDPRDFTIIAFGGAGPLLGCLLATEVNVTSVLVPPAPGTLCALGALRADVMSDFVSTVHLPMHDLDRTALGPVVQALLADAMIWLTREAPPVAGQVVQFSADLRYTGQSHEIEVPADAGELGNGRLAGLEKAFHALHQKLFSISDPAAPIEMISLRARAVGSFDWPTRAEEAEERKQPARPVARRPVLFHGERKPAAVYERGSLVPGQRLDGPAVIQQPDTTVLIPPGWTARIDRHANLLAKREGQP
jgi:N-methylhydantoinase A